MTRLFYALFYVHRRPGILVLVNDTDWELLVSIKLFASYLKKLFSITFQINSALLIPAIISRHFHVLRECTRFFNFSFSFSFYLHEKL